MSVSNTLAITISTQAQSTIRALAEKTNLPAQEIVDRAVEELRRKLLFEEANAAYIALQEQSEAWNEIERERKDWDTTLADGLESEDWSEYKSLPGA
ncbi:MAG: toxin-antitoxin system protein [Acidobacteriota bacterium]